MVLLALALGKLLYLTNILTAAAQSEPTFATALNAMALRVPELGTLVLTHVWTVFILLVLIRRTHISRQATYFDQLALITLALSAQFELKLVESIGAFGALSRVHDLSPATFACTLLALAGIYVIRLTKRSAVGDQAQIESKFSHVFIKNAAPLFWLFAVALPVTIAGVGLQFFTTTDPLKIERVSKKISHPVYIPTHLPPDTQYQEGLSLTDELEVETPTVRYKIGNSTNRAFIVRQARVSDTFDLVAFAQQFTEFGTTQSAQLDHSTFKTDAYIIEKHLPQMQNARFLSISALTQDNVLLNVTSIVADLDTVLSLFTSLEPTQEHLPNMLH